MNQFKKLNKSYRNFIAENARFFEYFVGILALKIGKKSNMIWDALYFSNKNIFLINYSPFNIDRKSINQEHLTS